MRVLELLRSQPALVLFLVIGVGYVLGRVRVGGVQLGASTGVLLGGLVLGHFGLHGSGASQSIGFMLFMYCVGLRAGPQFFTAFRESGFKFAILSVVVAAIGMAAAVAFGARLALPPGYSAGLLAGAMTSTPALDAVNRQAGSTLPTVGYAGTYAFANVLLATAGSLLMRF